jgi:RES domain-containing protein
LGAQGTAAEKPGEGRKAAANLPPVTRPERRDTHRLILSKYSPGGDSVLAEIAENNEHLRDIFDLDGATNDRLLAENQRLPGIGVHELVFGFPYATVVNASFTHAHPLGGRFNGPDRGAWYAGFELRTAQAEVAFHKTVQLAEVNRFVDEVTYDDYLADFHGEYHDLRSAPGFAAALDAASYAVSQQLAERLLNAESAGIVYPCVRRPRGTCICCFRPALVTHVRKDARYRFQWAGSPTPVVTRA